MRSTSLSCAVSNWYYTSFFIRCWSKIFLGTVLIRERKENEGGPFLNRASPGRWWLDASEVPRGHFADSRLL
jgi:hypothetical protein